MFIVVPVEEIAAPVARTFCALQQMLVGGVFAKVRGRKTRPAVLTDAIDAYEAPSSLSGFDWPRCKSARAVHHPRILGRESTRPANRRETVLAESSFRPGLQSRTGS